MKNIASIRRIIGTAVLLAITLLLLDFTGAIHGWLGWLAKIQFLPAVLAANFVVIAVLVALTLLFGRVYCSVVCPLGIFQDFVSWISGLRNKSRKRLRFSYSKEVKWLRYGVFAVFVVALVVGVQAFVALLAPYSAYGRIVTNLFQPVYRGINNLLAMASEHFDNYAFYSKDVWLKSLPAFVVAAATFAAVVLLAWKNGRTYCNTICPVGTMLSFFSRFAMFRPVIDTDMCRNCRKCEHGCKAACINIAEHKIDYSRCVDCFDCLEECKFGALHYRFGWKTDKAKGGSAHITDNGRRAFLVSGAMVLGAVTLGAQEKKAADAAKKTVDGLAGEDGVKRDGGFAAIIPKQEPERSKRLVPFGSISIKHFYDHCTACGLCIAACPNEVLRPSSDLVHLMQPYMSFEKGYCRPECTACSTVCPTGAILPITPEEKTAIKIGIAKVDYSLCVVNTDGVSCGNCARHCPAFAIRMVRKNPDDSGSLRIPTVMGDSCIGCGACENLCPARPISAIHVDGREVHVDNR